MLPRWLKRAVDVEDKGKLVSDQFLQIERAEQKRMQEALTCRVSYGSPGSKAPKKSFCLAGLEKGSKNRYNNIYPFDYSRVRLQGVPSGGCDYVNASFIESSRSNKRYIATQAPIPATFNDFWRVVWEQDIRVIVMLTAESEGPQLKCHPYWKAADYGPLKVSVFAEHQIPLYSFSSPRSQQQRRTHGQRRATSPFTQFEKPHATEGSQYFGVVANDNRPHAIVRHLTLTHTAYPFQPIREITQLQYSHWPDFAGTSSSNRPATTTMEPEPEGQRRVLVHCSAGCGRTGTYCTVDSVVDMLKRRRRRRAALADRKQPAAGGPSGDGGDDAGEQEVWPLREDVDLIAATEEKRERPGLQKEDAREVQPSVHQSQESREKQAHGLHSQASSCSFSLPSSGASSSSSSSSASFFITVYHPLEMGGGDGAVIHYAGKIFFWCYLSVSQNGSGEGKGGGAWGGNVKGKTKRINGIKE
ncbi:conserved hypothetical protein [Histoplasma capsulatum H143]|uniref:Protein tyrosine phosphatase n=1 Tax=Ajellomyces capsulatus (strain H143) TaxID=544712 RepID=C6H554_AJECH|nr:conserved hypothetical protein [Histoplasma capsulatum H143]